MKTLKSILLAAIIFATSATFAQTMMVDTENSNLKWHGEKVTGEHWGNIDLKEGWVTWKNDKITDGEFIIDMATITNADIEDEGYNAKLVGHLKSDDFFGVENYPTAKLEIKSSTAFKNNKGTVKAHLTIKETTLPVEFTAQKEGNWLMAEIIVDRSKYDVRYGSGSFFDDLGDKMIYDDFTMTVKVATISEDTAGM
jgi:polyisoprenoid-binding protein YceI